MPDQVSQGAMHALKHLGEMITLAALATFSLEAELEGPKTVIAGKNL